MAAWRWLVELLYPPRCLLCGVPPAADESFCADCVQLFDDAHLTCPRCAATTGPYVTHDGRCGLCRSETLGFDAALRLGPYPKEQGPLKTAVLFCKHARNEGLAELLGERWAQRDRERFGALKVDAVVPVPLHWRRRLWRGYNQSAALAYGLATTLGLPFRPRWLRRTRNTPAQRVLDSPSRRRDNVRGAFAVRRGVALAGQHLLLVDDVMTTAATASEAALALQRSGAGRVSVAVLARAGG